MAPMSDDHGGHVIVHGLEGLGLRVVEHLVALGLDVVAVDDGARPGAVQAATALGATVVPHVDGAAAALSAAGLSEARAVVCLSTDDLGALETALLVRRLRPQVTVVAQIRNAAVARAVRQDAGVTVLDVATVAAPAIVEACLGEGGYGFLVGDELVQVRSATALRSATLRELFGEDVVPLTVLRPGEEGEPLICPGRDLEVERGTVVSLLGEASAWARLGPELHAAEPGEALTGSPGSRAPDEPHLSAAPTRAGELGPARSPSSAAAALLHLRPVRLRAARAWGHALHQVVDTRLRRVLAALLVLASVSVVVLKVGYVEPDGTRMSLLDAVYFTVETIATIGYGDFSFREQPDWLRAYAVVLMVMGAVLATLTFALLTNMLVSRRLQESLGHGEVRGLRGHVVVVGLGTVGVRAAEALEATGATVVVVESSEDNRYLAQVRGRGVRVVSGDATLPRTLELVNLNRARALAVLTSDDLTNLEVALAARDQLAPGRHLQIALRLADRRLAVTVRQAFGLHHVRSTDELAAPWFVGAALGLDVLGTFYAGDVPLLYARVQVTPGGGLDGARIDSLTSRSRVLAIRRAGTDDVRRAIRRWTELEAGDEAFVVGPHEELLALLRRDGWPAQPAAHEPVTPGAR